MSATRRPLAKPLRWLLVPLIGLATVLCSAQTDEWNVAVGGSPGRTGLSTLNGPAEANLLWSGGQSAVISQQGVIDGDTLVIARMFNINDVLQGTAIIAYNLYTGAERWRTSLPVDFPSSDWRNKVSAARDGVVYATRAGNTNASYLYALRIADGSIFWKSQDVIDETSTEGVSFAPNGDVLAGSLFSVTRINAVDGKRVWLTSRVAPSSDGSNVTTYGNRVYGWQATAYGPAVRAWNLSTGQLAYESAPIGGGYVQQLGLFIGLDGTVYAPRSQNNELTDYLVAFTDTGTGLVEKWRVPIGFIPFASHAVGPDGTVYTYARSSPPTIVRLDPATGSVLDTSPGMPSDFFQPRIAVDAAGRVYFTNGAFSNGALYVFNADLTLRWTQSVSNVNLGGPALGGNGVLVVAGTGSNIRAYRDPVVEFLPTSFTIHRGVLQSGGLQSLLAVDGDRLKVKNGFVLNQSENPVDVYLEGVLPSAPSSLFFRLTARASIAGLVQRVYLFNFSTQSWVQVDSSAASTVDSTLSVQAPNVADYVEQGTRRVRARVGYRVGGPVLTASWTAELNQTVWRSQP